MRSCAKEKETLQAELVRITKKEEKAKQAAVEDVKMGGTGLPSQKIIVDVTMMTEVRTYTQAGAQAQSEVGIENEREEGKEKEKGKVPDTLGTAAQDTINLPKGRRI